MTSLGKIDPSLERAARDLGASRLGVLRHVLLPLSRKGLLGGFLLVFALTISSFTTPSILGGTTEVMATAIYTYVGYLTNFNLAAALAIVLMAVAIVVIVVSNHLGGGRRGAV
jgi:putative spermidine/putrescine transport system permease protein